MRCSRTVITAALLFAVACQGALLTLVLDRSAETTVEAGTLLEDLVGDLGFGDFLNMDLTTATELENQGVAPGDIQATFLTAFSLETLNPGSDFSFLERMELYVEAPQLPRVLVASSDDFGQGVTFVDFEVEDVDLTEYLVSASMSLVTEVTGRRPEQDTRLEAAFSVEVGVTTQGACNAIAGADS